jgi:hypothetical protein
VAKITKQESKESVQAGCGCKRLKKQNKEYRLDHEDFMNELLGRIRLSTGSKVGLDFNDACMEMAKRLLPQLVEYFGKIPGSIAGEQPALHDYILLYGDEVARFYILIANIADSVGCALSDDSDDPDWPPHDALNLISAFRNLCYPKDDEHTCIFLLREKMDPALLKEYCKFIKTIDEKALTRLINQCCDGDESSDCPYLNITLDDL